MSIYKLENNNSLSSVNELPIRLEKDIQETVENNLGELFNLEFIETEYQLNNLRIDTLAYNADTKSFVIIEYKKGTSFSVIDQGYAYLALLLNNKADFVLKFNEKKDKNFRRDSIDWSQSSVIFIANNFTRYQREAIGFQDLPIELWEFKKYQNSLISLNQITASEQSESITTINTNSNVEEVSKEVKKYSLEDHIRSDWLISKNLWEEFSQRVLELDSRITIKPVKYYIGFNINRNNIIAVVIRSNKITIDLLRVKPQDLNDPEKRTKYVERSFENYNKHITRFDLNNEEDIDYAMSLIKQVYKKFFAQN